MSSQKSQSALIVEPTQRKRVWLVVHTPDVPTNIVISSKDASFEEVSLKIQGSTYGAYSLRKDRKETTMARIRELRCIP